MVTTEESQQTIGMQGQERRDKMIPKYRAIMQGRKNVGTIKVFQSSFYIGGEAGRVRASWEGKREYGWYFVFKVVMGTYVSD